MKLTTDDVLLLKIYELVQRMNEEEKRELLAAARGLMQRRERGPEK